MGNIPPTEKEKLLMRLMSKLYSKEVIDEELTESIKQNGRSPLVEKAGNMLKIPQDKLYRIGIQYVNYINKNYEDVRDGIFPNEFERTVVMSYESVETIKEIQYNTVEANVYGLKSLEPEISEEVKDNFFEYDTDVVHTEYGDSDVIGYDYNGLTYVHTYKDNVIN